MTVLEQQRINRLVRFIKPNMLVWYYATPDRRYAGVVDSEPFSMGETWVVRLREMDAAYVEMHPAKRTTVPAVACWSLEPRK